MNSVNLDCACISANRARLFRLVGYACQFSLLRVSFTNMCFVCWLMFTNVVRDLSLANRIQIARAPLQFHLYTLGLRMGFASWVYTSMFTNSVLQFWMTNWVLQTSLTYLILHTWFAYVCFEKRVLHVWLANWLLLQFQFTHIVVL